MFRKLSTRIKGGRKQDDQSSFDTANHSEKLDSATSTRSPRQRFSFLPTQNEDTSVRMPETQAPEHTANRPDVESNFKQFAQVVHAARRPLPNQTGDGTYVGTNEHHSSLLADLRAIGFAD